MERKVCLVTGATSGIGKETARSLAAAGHRVVMVSRTHERGEAVANEIGGRTDLLVADLSSLANVRDLAARVLDSYPRIDVLINNAGVYVLRRRETPDGYEEMFAVNHLAPFLLTNLLLDRLRESAPSRIVVVASEAHRSAPLDFDDLQGLKRYRAFRNYGMTKLENIMFTYALARRLEGSGVTANCLHPGFVRSNFGSGNRVPVRPVMWLLTPFTISPRKAAEAPVWLATSPDLDGVSGKYFVLRSEGRSTWLTHAVDAQERLWEISARITGLDEGGSHARDAE